MDRRIRFEEQRRSNPDWPFQHPFYLILNLAIGGNLGGGRGINERAFPARLEVDHVRVYGRSALKPPRTSVTPCFQRRPLP